MQTHGQIRCGADNWLGTLQAHAPDWEQPRNDAALSMPRPNGKANSPAETFHNVT